MDIAPCPFCGKPAEYVCEDDHHGDYFRLGCIDEDCPAHWTYYTEPQENAEKCIARWNSRMHGVAQPEQEPVAWRYRFSGPEWRLSYEKPIGTGGEVQPLYAAQPPAAPVEKDADLPTAQDVRGILAVNGPGVAERIGMEATERLANMIERQDLEFKTDGGFLADDDSELICAALRAYSRPHEYCSADNVAQVLREARRFIERDPTRLSGAVMMHRLNEAIDTLNEPQATPVHVVADDTWPNGCKHPNSCSDHAACMYMHCRHEFRDISGEIKAALALSRPEQK